MLDIKRSVLLVVDVQGKHARMMNDKYYLRHINCMMKVAQLLKIPVIVTEQAPKKIGDTVDEILEMVPTTRTIHKESFSCYAQTAFVKKIKSWKRKQVIVTGIEAHGCVWQTVHDLLINKYEVFVVVDGVSAHSALNKDIALRRCEREGAVLTTVEMAATEFMRTAQHPAFREVMAILTGCFRKNHVK